MRKTQPEIGGVVQFSTHVGCGRLREESLALLFASAQEAGDQPSRFPPPSTANKIPYSQLCSRKRRKGGLCRTDLALSPGSKP